jgi:putative tryptophan/tyrosine transport system substrate-binding protein
MIGLSRRRLICGAVQLSATAAGLAVLSSACGLASSLTPRRMPRIAFLSPGPREAGAELVVDPFLDGLRDLGYIEGQTITIEWRFAVTNVEPRDRELLAEVIRLPVDVIVVASSTPAAFTARQATSVIPIVALNVSYPVETGLVASLARPEAGNMTALASNAYGVNAKRLDLLREVVAGLARVIALVNITTPAYDGVVWNELKAAGESAGVQIERINLQSADDMEDAVSRAALNQPDALFDAQNPLLLARRDRYAELALKYRLPTMTNVPDYVASGALMAYGPSSPAVSRRAAAYVDKILKDASPADLPVEQPTIFDFVVNVTTLNAFGFTIPPSVLSLVTEWIQ